MHNEVLENLVVVKRSGQRVSFNASKIAVAIKKAFDSLQVYDEKKVYKVFEKVLSYINENYKDRKTINVEDIQDIIENILKNEKCYDVYNSFKDYRHKRSLSRKIFTEKQQHKFLKAVENISDSSIIKQGCKNSDVIESLNEMISSEYTKAYVLDNKMNRASDDGNIYINNLYFPFGKVSKISLKLVCEDNIIALLNKYIQLQNDVYGEIAVCDFDETLEKYFINIYKNNLRIRISKYLELFGIWNFINKDEINLKISKIEEIVSADYFKDFIENDFIERIINFSLNDSLTYLKGLVANKILKLFDLLEANTHKNNSFSISFGKASSKIGNIINLEILGVLKKKRYLNIKFIFKNTSNASIDDLLDILDTNKSLYLNNSNFIYFTDGLKMTDDKYRNMILSDTTVNLARLGLKYQNKNRNDFFLELDANMELVKNELLLAFETLGNKTKSEFNQLFNFEQFEDNKLDDNQRIRKIIKFGNLVISVAGINECVSVLETDESKRVSLYKKIIKHLNELCANFSEENKLNFVLAEQSNVIPRKELIEIDKVIYGNLKGVTSKKFYDIADLKYFDINELKEIQKSYTGGKLITILVNKRNINEVIRSIKDLNIDFVKLEVNSHEN
ncbi:MAG: anaerobic ribonucleoside-triphosphate reductase [bacterium]|nr:anaerobic ribonucleoside-triphosphate reductase [bacterium]